MNKKYVFPVTLIVIASITIFFFPQMKYDILGYMIFAFGGLYVMKIQVFFVKKLRPIYREVFPKTNMDIDALVKIVFLLFWISLTGYLLHIVFQFFD